VLGALDKYTNAACDVIDRHGYFGGKHSGEGASYSVREGHTYTDRTGLYGPDCLTREIQYGMRPHFVSEYNYPMPNRFRAESPPLAALYGALTGTDCYVHFALGVAEWQRSHSKFSVYTPVTMGQFPALSLIFRRGYVKPGPVVYHVTASLADLYQLKGTPVSEDQNLDQFRLADVPAGGIIEADSAVSMDPLAYFVGQVVLDVTDGAPSTSVMDLSPFIDRQARVVRSATKEVAWDWGNGVVSVDAPCAQGAVGFLGSAGTLEFADVTVTSSNEYAAVFVVSLDGKPLSSSRNILVQVMTEDRNYGWKTEGDTVKTITDMGAPPIVVREMAGSVELRRRDAAGLRAIALDHNGYRREMIARGGAGSLRIELQPDVLYYVIVP
jgi:hypothetical protein